MAARLSVENEDARQAAPRLAEPTGENRLPG
jgi:hypothetical protein